MLHPSCDRTTWKPSRRRRSCPTSPSAAITCCGCRCRWRSSTAAPTTPRTPAAGTTTPSISSKRWSSWRRPAVACLPARGGARRRAWRSWTGCCVHWPCRRSASGSGMLRELARHFGTRPDAASHPLGGLWDQLNRRAATCPLCWRCTAASRTAPTGRPAGDQSCSLLQVLDALVQYRNGVFGHGGPRFEAFYEQRDGAAAVSGRQRAAGRGRARRARPARQPAGLPDRAAHAATTAASRSACASWSACRGSGRRR